jgi:hypothetical protein
LNSLLEVAIGGCYDPDIDFNGPIAADRFKFLLLQNAEKLDLRFERRFSHFVEKQSAALGDGTRQCVFLAAAI